MSTQAVENLIQGVSQQGAQNRRLTQCEAQFDCLNQPVEGCVARSGFDVVEQLFDGSAVNMFNAPIFRDNDERYQVFVGNGTIRIFNLVDGAEATVTMGTGAAAYLAVAGLPRKAFSLAAAEDVIFLANEEKVPAMGAGIAPTRPKEALFYFKAGSYLTTYVISVTLGSTTYQWQYQTPDNSVVANAQHITTSAICYALYNAMVTDPVNSITTHLGFNAQRVGSIMRIWRNDATDFSIDVQDGQGNTQLLGFKETVGGFDKLPASGFNGFVLKVLGDAKEDADDYYVQFTGGSSTGVWEECAKPGVLDSLNPATMPLQLKNTAPNTFVLEQAPWGERVVGDEASSKTPSFVGKKVREIAFDNARLLILTQGTAVWSRNENPYVFFPDTVQAKLATAPVDYQVKASKKIAVLSTVLQTDAATFLWAEDRQFLVDTSDLPFASENLSIPPSSSFEFNEAVAPMPVGDSVIFVSDNGPWSTVRDLKFREQQLIGTTGLTDHAPNYVPAGLTWAAATDTGNKAVFFSPDTPDRLYVYEWHFSADQRVLSAWQTWRLPAGCTILWGVFDRAVLYLTVQREFGGVYLLKTSFAPYQTDAEPGSDYITRLDLRVTDAAMTVEYDAGTGFTTFTLPYDTETDPENYRLVTRESHGEVSRGYQLTIASWDHSGTASKALVQGNWQDHPVYGGWRISSERWEGQFFPRNQEGGYLHAERTTVNYYTANHAKSGYYRLEARHPVTDALISVEHMTGRFNGDQANTFGLPVLNTGSTKVSVAATNDQHRVRLINDSFLPSAWQSAVWDFSAR